MLKITVDCKECKRELSLRGFKKEKRNNNRIDFYVCLNENCVNFGQTVVFKTNPRITSPRFHQTSGLQTAMTV